MKKLRYQYERGYSIEIVGFDPHGNVVVGAVMLAGMCKYEGSLVGCLKFLRSKNSVKAKVHLQAFHRATQDRAMAIAEGLTIGRPLSN